MRPLTLFAGVAVAVAVLVLFFTGMVCLVVSCSAQVSSVTIDWTAPGDDGNVGKASSYQMRSSTIRPDTTSAAAMNAWWASAATVQALPVPLVAGSAQSKVVPGPFQTCERYYFVMKACDEVPNCSGYSNVAMKVVLPALADTVPPPPPPPPPGAGPGLVAEYFDEREFAVKRLTRIDPAIDFTWGRGSPDPLVAPDTWSARWTGYITPLYSQTYTFWTISDDGVRLFIDGKTVIQQWTNHVATQHSGTIALVGGARYSLVMEHYDNAFDAVARLFWSSASQPKQVVPASRLSH